MLISSIDSVERVEEIVKLDFVAVYIYSIRRIRDFSTLAALGGYVRKCSASKDSLNMHY